MELKQSFLLSIASTEPSFFFQKCPCLLVSCLFLSSTCLRYTHLQIHSFIVFTKKGTILSTLCLL